MFDVHVHAAPDVWERADDDAGIVGQYAAAGFTGCVLKGHYDATAARAVAASRAGGTAGLRVFGGQVLNQHVGGVNPAAVAAALAMGARVIWMPTADAHTQRAADLPRLCGRYPSLASMEDTVYAVPPVDPAAEEAVRQIVALIAEADAVLATGHLSTAEVAWLLPVAREAGVRRLLMTHPSYTVPAMAPRDAARLAAEHGAYAEVTACQLLHQPDCDAARLAAFVREVGCDRVVLASDAGQVDSPPPPRALQWLVETLEAEGLAAAALAVCAAQQPEQLVVP